MFVVMFMNQYLKGLFNVYKILILDICFLCDILVASKGYKDFLDFNFIVIMSHIKQYLVLVKFT